MKTSNKMYKKDHPNLNLKKLLDGLKEHHNALILKAQKDEIVNNKEFYPDEYSFEEDPSGMYLVSLSVGNNDYGKHGCDDTHEK